MFNLIRVASGEGYWSTIKRWFRSLNHFLNGPSFPYMDHYCPGESGSGAWSHRSKNVPSRCGYCGKPNDALRKELRRTR